MEKPRTLFLHGLPADRRAWLGYSCFTAADEKIPLSVVQVNNKPQYLVFCWRSRHLPLKRLYLSVESVNGLARCGLPSLALPQTLCKLELAALFSPSLKPSRTLPQVQGAETVQFGDETVGVVDNGPGNVGSKNHGGSYCSNCDLLGIIC